MSSCIEVVPEQLCYIPCNFCNIVLAVSVPCSSLFDIVTVRCGHCTNLWSVNMAAAASQSLSWQDIQAPNNAIEDYRRDLGSSSKCSHKLSMQPPLPNNATEERVVNRPPEKRQRVPSAYNRFIKEEIQRIKANNPDISHREAFSTAAKNLRKCMVTNLFRIYFFWFILTFFLFNQFVHGVGTLSSYPFWADAGNQQPN